jgi:hypothetical protein
MLVRATDVGARLDARLLDPRERFFGCRVIQPTPVGLDIRIQLGFVEDEVSFPSPGLIGKTSSERPEVAT